MNATVMLSERRLAGTLFLLGWLLGLAGILMFTNRNFLSGRYLPSNVVWERCLIAVAALALLVAFVLLAAALRATGEHVFSWMGLTFVALGTLLTLVVEWQIIVAQGGGPRPAGALTWAFVALILVGQAAYGAALLQTALLPHWVGWLMVIWSVASLAFVVFFSPNDPYYPVLFYVSPVVLSILLLRS